MIRKVLILIISIIFLIGCNNKINQNDGKERMYLSNEYYNKGNFIEIKQDDLKNLNDKTYILFTNNNYCSLNIPCDEIFLEFMKKYQIDFLSMPFNEFKETKYYETVLYAPSVIIISNQKIIAYLDANSNDDLDKYQDVNKFEKWLNKYVYFANN